MGKDFRILYIYLGGIILHNILRKISASLAVLMLLALSAPVLTYAASMLKVYYDASTGEISGVIYSDQKDIAMYLINPNGRRVQVPSSVLGEVYHSDSAKTYWSKVNGTIAQGLVPGFGTVVAGDARDFAASVAGNVYSFVDDPIAPRITSAHWSNQTDKSSDIDVHWQALDRFYTSYYKFYNNDQLIGITGVNSIQIKNLPAHSLNHFKVSAVDVFGRESDFWPAYSIRTPGFMKEVKFLFSGKEPGHALQPNEALISFVISGNAVDQAESWSYMELLLNNVSSDSLYSPYTINHSELSASDFELVNKDGTVFPVSNFYNYNNEFNFTFPVPLKTDQKYILKLTSSASGHEISLPNANSQYGRAHLHTSFYKKGESDEYVYEYRESGIVTGDPYAPAKPTGLKAWGNGSLYVTWDSNKEDDLAGYLVWLDGSLLTEPIKRTNFTINGLTNGKIYHVNVAAVDKMGNRSLQAYIFPVPQASGGGTSGGGSTPGGGGGSAAGGGGASGPSSTVPAVVAVKSPISVVDQTGATKALDIALKSENGKVTVPVASDIKQLLLPASSEAINKDNALVVSKDNLSIEIPGGDLEKLKASVPAEQLKDAKISVSFTPLSSDDIAKATSGTTGKSANTAITSAGAAFDFGLSLITADGKETKLSEFDFPVTLKLKVNEGVNTPLTGVYYLDAQGGLQYTAGQQESGYLSVQTSHFSKYAVLQYSKSFSDVSATHWASGAIQAMVAQQVVTGTSDLHFSPNQKVTRAEFAAFIARKLNLKAGNASGFSDVGAAKWYADEVAAASAAGIVTGISGSAFAPDKLISRQEMTAMLIKSYLYKNNKSLSTVEASSAFADYSSISKWARPYVAYAHELGLIQGRSGNKFQPLQNATRAEAVQLISKL
ncbi:S-layer homology domain-containing protein [Paenibacillus sp. 22594]|uniref:S-layer homology domain-containing protein n=1 Tax=Paenibacillus sp. 22594 TaxID=3453947 RepID=UPI003F83590C